MPKDPKRNLQRYQIQGGHLNEFEFQKSQGEMAEESELPFTDETQKPNLTQAKRIAAMTAEAHQKVEKRRKRGVAKAGNRQSKAASKGSAKKAAGKAVKKTAAPTGMTKRAGVKRRSQKAAY